MNRFATIAWHWRSKVLLWLGAGLLLLNGNCVADPALPSQVIFAGDIWCPYNCAEGAKEKGALVDLLENILATQHIQLTYRVIPWSRALQEVSEGKLDGIIGAGLRDAQHATLTAKPWLYAELAALTHKEAQFRWRGLDSLDGKSVVVIANYEYAAPLPDWLAAHQAFVHVQSGENAFRQAVMLVQHRRQDVFFSSYPALQQYVVGNDLSAQLQVTRTGLKTPIYMAVSKKTPYGKQLLDLLNRGYTEITANGKANELLRPYDL